MIESSKQFVEESDQFLRRTLRWKFRESSDVSKKNTAIIKKRNCIIIKWSNVLKQCAISLGITTHCKLKKAFRLLRFGDSFTVWMKLKDLYVAGSKIKLIVVNSLFFKINLELCHWERNHLLLSFCLKNAPKVFSGLEIERQIKLYLQVAQSPFKISPKDQIF